MHNKKYLFLILLFISGCSQVNEIKSFKNKSGITFGSTTTTRSWRTSTLVDFCAAGGSCNSDYNESVTAGTPYYSMALFSDSALSFYLAITRNTNLGHTLGYVTQNASLSASSWAIGTSQYISTSTCAVAGCDVSRPLAVVDSLGNSYLITIDRRTAGTGALRPMAYRKATGTSTWSTGVDLADTSLDTFGTHDVTNSIDVAVDASNSAVVVYRQNTNIFFNEYRPVLGWRYSGSGFAASARISAAADVGLVNDEGVSVAFDALGYGYAAYIANTNERVVTVRWDSSLPAKFDTTNTQNIVTGGTGFREPKLWVTPDGQATVFYLNTTGAGRAEIWKSTTTSGVFTAPTQVDDLFGDLTSDAYTGVTAASDRLRGPILSTNGNYAVLGIIKEDVALGNRRLRIFRGYQHNWTDLGYVDLDTGSVQDVGLAIHSDGTIIASYSALENFGVNERTYAAIYSSGSWGNYISVDDPSGLSSSYTANVFPKPSVKFDSSGNAVVSLSGVDSGGFRRAIVIEYR